MPALPAYPVQPAPADWPARQWPRAPLSTRVNKSALADLLADAFDPRSHARMGETHAFLAIQNGCIVAERYFEPRHTRATTNASWSMAKSITQVLIGFLAAEGKIDPDAPLGAPEWAAKDDPRAALTWTQLLHMTSGLSFVEEYIPGNVSDVIEMLFGAGQDDVAGYAARLALAHAPDTAFNYASGTSNILARALGAKLGGGADAMKAFMHERLFAPLGITSAVPKFDAAGTFIGSSYCFMTAEDFARIGLLALRGGVWQGRRLLPASWFDFARTQGPVTLPRDNYPDGRGYGAHWWLNMWGPDTFSMNGYGGQWVACCPHRDLIIVRHGDSVNTAEGLRQDAARRWLNAVFDCFA